MDRAPTTMTIPDLEAILSARGLTAVREDYTKKEWYAIQGWPGPSRKQANTPVAVLRVRNPLHGKDFRFDFFWRDNDFLLWDMYFGNYDYEIFLNRDVSAVMEAVDEVLHDKIFLITWNKVRAVPHGIDSAYWKSDCPELDDSAELATAVARLRKKAAKGAWLFGKEGKFEVYSWNTYECIAPETRK